jgi:protein Mpv17
MRRFVTLAIFGFIYHGPSGHYFYNWLDSKIPGTRGQDIALKVGIDQILWCPVRYVHWLIVVYKRRPYVFD